MMFDRYARIALLIALLSALPVPAAGSPTFSVTFNDPGGLFSSFYAPIQSNLLAAGGNWANLISSNANLEVEVQFNSSFIRAAGFSATNAIVGSHAGRTVLQDGAGYELRTGIDLNSIAPDIIIGFNPTYLINQVWFDPSPTTRTVPVPAGKTDAVSIFMHELAHGFGMNGFRNLLTGDPLAFFESGFDALVAFDTGFPFFVGPLAEAVYGGPVPLTFFASPEPRVTENIFHLGNIAPGPGTDLIDDLMNGIVFFTGTRYFISDLDRAIIGDLGVPLPLPPAIVLLGVGVACVLVGRRITLGRAQHTSTFSPSLRTRRKRTS